MSELKQIKPAACKRRDFAENLHIYTKGQCWAEEKFDGARYLAHVHKDITYFTGRRISVVTDMFVDKTYNVPHLYSAMTKPKLVGTIFDGEITVPGSMVNSVTKIMGCTAGKAIARQEATGWVNYIMFDILFCRGQDVRAWSQEKRRLILLGIYRKYFENHPNIHVSRAVYPPLVTKLYQEIMAKGGEGIVIKNSEAPYGDGWTKVKKILEDSVIVIGFAPGKGKYSNMIGAIQFGQWDNGTIKGFGQCSGMDDATRQWITDNKGEVIGKVFDIKFQERFPTGKFREPRFLRFRNDIDPLDPEGVVRK